MIFNLIKCAKDLLFNNANSDIEATDVQGAIDEVKSIVDTKEDAINLTKSRALVSDSSGKVAVSAVTSAELGYLDGVTSKIQTQLNNKMGTSNPNFTGNMRGGSGCSIGGLTDLLDSIYVNAATINTINGFYPAYSQADNWGSGTVLSKVTGSNTNILFLVGTVSGATDLPPGNASEWAFLVIRDKTNIRQVVIAFGYNTSQIYVRHIFRNAWSTNWVAIHS